MQLRGWRFAGERPPHQKFVAIGAPHTSNWDFLLFLSVVSHIRMPARVIGKRSLVRWPFGRLMRWLGIIPLERDTGQGMVEQMVAEFAAADAMVLVIAPEGTRRRADFWHSGFYRIAREAGVPIALTYIDADAKVAGIGPVFQPTGDVAADMLTIRQFYSPIRGIHPENQGPIELRPEAP